MLLALNTFLGGLTSLLELTDAHGQTPRLVKIQLAQLLHHLSGSLKEISVTCFDVLAVHLLRCKLIHAAARLPSSLLLLPQLACSSRLRLADSLQRPGTLDLHEYNLVLELRQLGAQGVDVLEGLDETRGGSLSLALATHAGVVVSGVPAVAPLLGNGAQ